jgi:hypothetical protein
MRPIEKVDSLHGTCQTPLILPGFDVHQKFDSVLMNGGPKWQRNRYRIGDTRSMDPYCASSAPAHVPPARPDAVSYH